MKLLRKFLDKFSKKDIKIHSIFAVSNSIMEYTPKQRLTRLQGWGVIK